MNNETVFIEFRKDENDQPIGKFVDTSISIQIQALVDAGIQVEGCDINDGGPMVLLPADADEETIEKAFEILEQVDHRTWNICQWRLTLVGVPNAPDQKPPLIVGPNGRGGGLRILGRGRG